MESLHHEVSEDRLMETMPILGIDISKKKFDVALLRDEKFRHKHFTNDKKGFKALSAWLEKQKAPLVKACMESTGIYGEALSEYLFDQGHSVSVVNPSHKANKGVKSCITTFRSCLFSLSSLTALDDKCSAERSGMYECKA